MGMDNLDSLILSLVEQSSAGEELKQNIKRKVLASPVESFPGLRVQRQVSEIFQKVFQVFQKQPFIFFYPGQNSQAAVR